MKVEIHLKHQSQPVICEDVRNAYQKGDFYCLMYQDRSVDKFPVQDVFRVREFSEKTPRKNEGTRIKKAPH